VYTKTYKGELMTNFVGYEFPKCAKKGSTFYLLSSPDIKVFVKKDTWQETTIKEYIDLIRNEKGDD
jgi:hypothetical protein